MTAFTSMDKAAAKAIGQAVAEHLERGDLAEWLTEHGLTAQRGSGSYDPTAGTFSMKVTFALGDSEQRAWDAYCSMYGLTPEDRGATFKAQGKTFTIQSLNTRAPKRPIICVGSDGRSYAFPDTTVCLALGREAEGTLTQVEVPR